MKKIIVLSIILFSPFHFLHAGLVINEVMYDLPDSDANREWVEIFNDSKAFLDLSTFSFFEADVNHRLVLAQGSKKIEAQSYAIIVDDPVKFKKDWPDFEGNIFDSSFSLSNTGEILVLKNGSVVVDEYVYESSSGGAGDGNSLQKINGVWAGATPTPGKENKISEIQTPQNQNLVENKNEIRENKFSTENLPIDLSLSDKTRKWGGDFYFFGTIFLVFATFSAWLVYLIRKKKNVSKIGDDFELLD